MNTHQTLPISREQYSPADPGFSYRAFPGEADKIVQMPTFTNDEGRVTYLVAVSETDTGWIDRVSVMRAAGISCHLLPAQEDSYTRQEREFAENTLGTKILEINEPYINQSLPQEAIVFDPSSPKSILDVLIRTGHDSTEIRTARRAALRSEKNHIVEVLQQCIDISLAGDPERSNAQKVYKDIFGSCLQTPAGFVEELVENGLSTWSYTKVDRVYRAGLDPELIHHYIEDPERAQEAASMAWQEGVASAHIYNRQSNKEGIYTEIHKIGSVLVLMPAIASTDWHSCDSSLGTVDVRGGGHTLAEMYADFTLPKNKQPLDEVIVGSRLVRLARALGMSNCGKNTLQRRCLTRFDEKGLPYVQIFSDDPYGNRPDKLTDEELFHLLSREKIPAWLKEGDEKAHLLTAENGVRPVAVSLQEVAENETRLHGDLPIGVLVSARNGGQLTWAVGYAKQHQTLRQNYWGESETDLPTIKLGIEGYTVKADYFVTTDPKTGGFIQRLLWNFTGDLNTFLLFKEKVASIVRSSEQAFSEKWASWNTVEAPAVSEIAVTNPKTGKYVRVELSVSEDPSHDKATSRTHKIFNNDRSR